MLVMHPQLLVKTPRPKEPTSSRKVQPKKVIQYKKPSPSKKKVSSSSKK
jgi:hypothetical protein